MPNPAEDFLIPEEKYEAVTRGLSEAFGTTTFEDISRVYGGQTSSLVFRIVVSGVPYLLKVITRSESPARHYTNMKAAAAAGLAPRVWYTDTAHKISITDFVNAAPLPRAEALLKLPALLRTLHSLPPFERAPFNTTSTFLLDKGPALDEWLRKFRAANTLATAEAEQFFALYAEIAAAYPNDAADMVSSHNDLYKPDNILFDGRRVWLVDWEASFLNDRYVDLAVVANQLVTNEEEELAYLKAYFGTAPDDYQLARFHLMQQLSHLFYTMAYLFFGSSGKPVDWSGTMPDLSDYQRQLWARQIDLVSQEEKILYARVNWERLLHNVRQPRYAEALRTLSHRPATTSSTPESLCH